MSDARAPASLARADKIGSPCSIIIFGASGDLTRRKLVPALYRLCRASMIDRDTKIIGFARRPWDDAAFRTEMKAAVAEFAADDFESAAWDHFENRLRFCSSTFDDDAGYANLKKLLTDVEPGDAPEWGRLFYLATAPSFFPVVLEQIQKAALATREATGARWSRCIIEKPFGRDLVTARELNHKVNQVFFEPQVYRIDHYLGKETVQNILVFRHANGIFEPLWNNRFIDHVQISQCETLGMEGRRGAYFDTAGVLRDILQNHVLQLLTLVAMEPPARFEADDVRDEKVKVLHSMKPLERATMHRHVVRAQYLAGSVGETLVPGYLEEDGVAADSRTDAYVALALEVENWRWAGVPFFLRTGKRLPGRVTQIDIIFKQPPFALFHRMPHHQTCPNILTLRIQPDEGISIQFGSKVPGPDIDVHPVRMDFFYSSSFGVAPREAYERLLLDAMVGDSTLFARRDEVEAAWEICTPILDYWDDSTTPAPETYAAGTWGPVEAEIMLKQFGKEWKPLG
jgi:glucose-6-phosphate 1-dehydrogenase